MDTLALTRVEMQAGSELRGVQRATCASGRCRTLNMQESQGRFKLSLHIKFGYRACWDMRGYAWIFGYWDRTRVGEGR